MQGLVILVYIAMLEMAHQVRHLIFISIVLSAIADVISPVDAKLCLVIFLIGKLCLTYTVVQTQQSVLYFCDIFL